MVADSITRHFASPPVPLSRGQRMLVWILSIAVALTRWPALSRTLWDWDEALFALALRDYDVRFYHPHPPGFPLFIGLAKLIPSSDAFHALQAIAFVASLLVFPAAFFLARALRAGTFIAVASGLLLAFSPNVWFYGGTALSDVPSMVLSLFAAAMLLVGDRQSCPSLGWTGRIACPPLFGAILLGVAASFRPQNLIIGLVPLAIAFLIRRRAAIAGALIAAMIIAASYGVAAAESGGWDAYRDTLAEHERYIRRTDSFLSPIRPSLIRVADDFFFRPYRAPAINGTLALLIVVALWRRRAHVLFALAVFGPFCLFAWLYLDFHSASRFSIAYMPLFAILAADGIDAARKARSVVLAGVVALMVAWTWPALRIVHRTPSPPVAATGWIQSRLMPMNAIVYVDERLAAHGELLLEDYEHPPAIPVPIAVMHERARVSLLQEGPGEIYFTRDRTRLANLARRRYFDTSVVELPRIAFVDGWYAEEGPVRRPWRWMGRRSRTMLPRIAPRSRISVSIAVPDRAVIHVHLDGRLLERIDAPRGTVERTWDLGAARELVIETDAIVRAPGDPRELGLRLDRMLVHR